MMGMPHDGVFHTEGVVYTVEMSTRWGCLHDGLPHVFVEDQLHDRFVIFFNI